MTGYHPDFSFLESRESASTRKRASPNAIRKLSKATCREFTSLASSSAACITGEIFIENGRFHGRQIVAAMTGHEGPKEPAPVSPPGE